MKLKILLILIILTSYNYSQNSKENVTNNINNFLEYIYEGVYSLNTIIDLDDHLGDMRYNELPTEDPYQTLKDSYFFVAEADNGDILKGNIIGIFSSGEVLWYSEPGEISLLGGYSLFTTKDINMDKQVEILITSGWGEELWIYSWNGETGKRINEKNEWMSVIEGPKNSFTLFDAEGDGILEIKSLAEKDGSKAWSWNGQMYGKWNNTPVIPDTTWLPRNNIIADVECNVLKKGQSFTYNYKVNNDDESRQRINYFTLECNIDSLIKSQPEGWDGRVHWVNHQKGWGTEVFYWNKPKEVLPGNSLGGFQMISSNLPSISLYFIRAENMLPLTTEFTGSQDSADFVNNSVNGYTISPSYSRPIIKTSFLDTLFNFTSRSLELGWIKEEIAADKYTNYFNSAKAALQQNNISAVQNALNNVLQDVKTDSGSVLTSEAYALLRYNTEYLLENLPEEPAPNLKINLLNSSGEPLIGGALKYYEGSWKDAIDNGDGTFIVNTERETVSLRMIYEGGSQTVNNIPAQNNSYTFRTTKAAVNLLDSQGNLIQDEAAVKYYAGSWRDFGATINGVAEKELLPNSYTFRMIYEGGSNDKKQDISENPEVDFNTVNASVKLLDSGGNLIQDEASVKYYAGSWRDFDATINGVAEKELLPKKYSFRITHNYISNDKQQDISSNPNVEFPTILCEVKVNDAQNNPVDGAEVKYYSGAWRNLGTTQNGVISKEMLPKELTFRASYNGDSKDIKQNTGVNNVVEFNLNGE